MVSTRTFLNKMLVGDVTITGEMSTAIAEGAPAGGVIMMSAIDDGHITIEGGTKEDVQKFFSYFDLFFKLLYISIKPISHTLSGIKAHYYISVQFHDYACW